MQNNVDNSKYPKYLFYICLTAILSLMLSRIFSLLLVTSFPDFAATPFGMTTQMAVSTIIAFLLPAVHLNQILSFNGRFISYEPLLKHWRKSLVYPLLLLLALLPLTNLLSDLGREIMSMDIFSGQREAIVARDAQLKQTYDLLLKDVSAFDYIVNIIFFGFIVGFSEELFFRGIVQNYLCRIIKSGIVAVLFSAIIFSVAHFDYNELLSRTLLGFAIGYVYYKTDNIFASVLMHVANNVIAVVFYSCSNLENYINQWYVVLVGILMALFVVFRYERIK